MNARSSSLTFINIYNILAFKRFAFFQAQTQNSAKISAKYRVFCIFFIRVETLYRFPDNFYP